jgi:glycosyltransferase involved in cell wall biosynthesis
MRILFVHQNFPAQFKSLAPELKRRGHDVTALSFRTGGDFLWSGIKVLTTYSKRGTTKGLHPWLTDTESKVIRGEACLERALMMKRDGYEPDIIYAHPGWGEALFLNQVWPVAKIILYCEFYYKTDGADFAFDKEFQSSTLYDRCRIELKNINNDLSMKVSNVGVSPTSWQASTYPAWFRKNIFVCHDGVDVQNINPSENVVIRLGNGVVLKKGDNVVTFVNRNLEPYRGYHIFMRALPEVVRRFPTTQILIVGDSKVSYGSGPPDSRSWKDYFFDEVRSQLTTSEADRIHYLGTLPYEDYLAILNVSAVHVYATYPFVLGWSLLEAMALECAIVASDVEPVREVIEDDVQGTLFPFHNPEELSDKIIALLTDPQLGRALGKAARRRVIEQFDLRTVCLPKLTTYIESLV